MSSLLNVFASETVWHCIVSFLILLSFKWLRIYIKCNGKSSSFQECTFPLGRFFLSAFQQYLWKFLLNLICTVGVLVLGCRCVFVCVHSQGYKKDKGKICQTTLLNKFNLSCFESGLKPCQNSETTRKKWGKILIY